MVQNDLQLFIAIRCYTIPFTFNLPITAQDATNNSPAWQIEKQRYLASIAAESLTIEYAEESELDIEDTTTFESIVDLPPVPIVPIPEVEPLVVQVTSSTAECINSVAVLDSAAHRGLWSHVKEVFNRPNPGHVAKMVQLHEEVKVDDNTLADDKHLASGINMPLIRSLIYDYVDCKTAFSMKRAYPNEQFKPRFCSNAPSLDFRTGITEMATPIEKHPKRRDMPRRCICTTIMYKAAFQNDLYMLCFIHQVRKHLTSPKEFHGNYFWLSPSNGEVRLRIRQIDGLKIVHCGIYGKLVECFISPADKIVWERFLTFNL